MDELYQVIYLSTIAPNVSPSCIADIVRVARRTNAQMSISGLLVFDGWRFCQYLEGPETHVRSLMEKIIQDPRHHQISVLHQGPFPGPRHYQGWAMGYALASNDELLPGLESNQGPHAVTRLHTLIPQLDLEPMA